MILLLVVFWSGFLHPGQTLAQEKGGASFDPVSQALTLEKAAICEEIKGHAPQNQAVVFSITNGSVCCFTAFDPVPEKTFIYHNWFYRDNLAARVKLGLAPPRWSTFSRIHLREADKGPWRVEIIDQHGTVFRILRFSITD